MLVFRIALSKYAVSLVSSGRAARWNPNETDVIYTACSRSLACLENVVHRNQIGLNQAFKVMTIEIPDDIRIINLDARKLPADWTDFQNMPTTQRMGTDWINDNKSAILRVPSAIINAEYNYLLNPVHPDFKSIKLLKSEAFIFDRRIKV